MAESMTRWEQGAGTREALKHGEGNVARAIEEQTAKLPSDAWLWAAFASIGISLLLHASGKRKDGLFVGQWVAPFLLFGVYNKIVKAAGYDRISGRL